MQDENKDIKKCWICADIANSKEHKIKKSDIIKKYGKGNYRGDNEVCIISDRENFQSGGGLVGKKEGGAIPRPHGCLDGCDVLTSCDAVARLLQRA